MVFSRFDRHAKRLHTTMIPAGLKRTKIRAPRKLLVLGSNSENTIDYDASWQVLASAIRQIQQKNVSNLLYEQLYRKAYTLVLRKSGGRLYDDVAALISEHLRHRRNEVLLLSQLQDPEDFLKAAVREWAEHLQLMKFISDVLMYLNRVYVRENKKLLVYDLGVVLFDVNFIRLDNMALGNKLIQIVVDEITKSRQGRVITSRLYITQVMTMFEMLSNEEPGVAASVPEAPVGDNLFHQHFEKVFFDTSTAFYSALSEEFLASHSGSKYLLDTHKFLNDEEHRLRLFIPQSTCHKLIGLLNLIFIKDKIDRVILLPKENYGLLHWLDPLLANVVSVLGGGTALEITTMGELRTLYELISRIDPDHKLLKVRLKEAIVRQGLLLPSQVVTHLEVAGNAKKAASTSSVLFALAWIDAVLVFYKQYASVTKNAFHEDYTVDHSIYEAMREFINVSSQKKQKIAPSTNAPELLSVYMDQQIKQLLKSSGVKRADSDSVDATQEFLHKALGFLRFIKDKDAFEAHYANHFAKRFLNSKGSTSIVLGVNAKYNGDIEELVIAKLGEELGSASLEKIIRMKKDVKLSIDLTMEWKNHVGQQSLRNMVDLELKVCHVSDWPKSMTKDYKTFARDNDGGGFIWPTQLRETMNTFEQYWLTGKKNDNKLLFWCPKFGLMELRISYPTKTYDILLSTYAGVIMLLFAPSRDDNGDLYLPFEHVREYTFDEILELTRIPEPELKRQLQLVAVAPRLRLLVKTPMSKDVNNSDTFRLNEKFKSPTTKVKVLTVSASSAKEGPKEKQQEADEVKANIEEGRKHLVDAAIVRILKSRQSISHNDLIAELYKQLHLRFQPLTILMKQRIEDLIEKEYLKRDDQNVAVYHYIA